MSAFRGAPTLILRIVAAGFTLLIAPYASIKSRAALLDPDIWWHLRVGQWISQQHALPHNAIFSQHSERAWVAYSWGFELLVSGVNRMLGLAGIAEVLIVLQILLSLVLFLSLFLISRRFWLSWLAATLAVYSDYTVAFRPALLTSLFLTLVLLLIFEVERRREDRLLFWIAPLFLLWANCHIQFIYGLFVLGLYALCRTVPVLTSRFRPQSDLHEPEVRGAVKPWLAFGLAGLACCVGPYGILPFTVAFSAAGNTRQYQLIQELAANDFRHPEDFSLLLLVMAGAWALGRARRFDLFRMSLLAVSAMVSFRSIRDAWFVAVVAAFMFVESFRREPQLEAAVLRREWVRNSTVFASGVVVALAMAFSIAGSQGLDMTSLSFPVNVMFPVRAGDFIRTSGLPGPMFNTFAWGGFLIYNLPEQPVSMDGRVDVYGSDLVARNIDTEAGKGWQNDPDFSRANFVLLRRVSPLAAILVKAPGYRLVYQDALAVVFVRQSS